MREFFRRIDDRQLFGSLVRWCYGGLVLAGLLSVTSATAQSPAPTFDNASMQPSTIGPGGGSTLRLEISNASSQPVTDLGFSVTLPAALGVATPSGLDNGCGGVAAASGASIELTDGAIAGNASCVFFVDLVGSTIGGHSVETSPLVSAAGSSAAISTQLTVAADRPGFVKAFVPEVVPFGSRSRLRLTFDNTANVTGASNLRFSDPLPTGMAVASPANATSDCGGGVVTAASGSSHVSFAPAFFGDATVGAGASCTVAVDVLAAGAGALENQTGDATSTPTLGGQERSSGHAGAVLQTTTGTLAFTKSFADDPVPPGALVTLQFTIVNLSRRDSATDISFTDDLDAMLAGAVAVSTASDPCGPGSTLAGTDQLTLSAGVLGPEGSCTFSATVQVPAVAASGQYPNTTSLLSASVAGGPVTAAAATDVLFVEPVPQLTKTFLDDPVGTGGATRLEFVLTNTSPSLGASEIQFEDVFDVVLPTASSVPADGFCGPASQALHTPLINPTGSDAIPARLVVSGASLGAGASCTFEVTVDVAVAAEAGIYHNTTSPVTALVDGEEVVGPPASDALEILAAPALTKEFLDEPIAPGGTVDLLFTLNHPEYAADDATDIAFTDDLDAVLSGLETLGLPASDVCGVGSALSGLQTLALTGGTLAPGESCSFAVTLAVPTSAPAGSHQNTTSAVMAEILGVSVLSPPAVDALEIAGLTATKDFLDDPVIPGGTVTLEFVLSNDSAVDSATGIQFSDNLDGVLDDLTATGLPLADPCGVGSSLNGLSGGRTLSFVDGSLGPGESCSFSVSLEVPPSTVPDDYINVTSNVVANMGGSVIGFAPARDDLVVSEPDFLAFAKAFTDDPVAPGGQVTLRFELANSSATTSISDIAFDDDLDAILPEMTSTSGSLVDPCGAGSLLTGTDQLSFSGGSLAPNSSCTFEVVVQVPASAQPGVPVTNVTSELSASAGGVPMNASPAIDTLEIAAASFSKSFDATANPGGSVGLTFTLSNQSGTGKLTRLGFLDDLDAVVPGLLASDLPLLEVCGPGSRLDGANLLIFTEGTLLPGGSCSFTVELSLPVDALAGEYLNVTSSLTESGLPIAQPAVAQLEIVEVTDTDDDGVLDGDDVCPGTVIPEGVPTIGLRPNRYALVDDDTVFDTLGDSRRPQHETFTTQETAGCSCEQIIDAMGLGQGHVKFGCSIGVMREWVKLVQSAAAAIPEKASDSTLP